jgi:hypothetical protein
MRSGGSPETAIEEFLAMEQQPRAAEDLNRLPAEEELGRLQWTTLDYYLKESNPVSGLIRDKTDPTAPASIAAVGMALATIPIIVERGVVPRDLGAALALKRLRFFHASAQGPEPDATGYRGFYYHFLDMDTGRRVWKCELSTIDSALLFAGMKVRKLMVDLTYGCRRHLTDVGRVQ